ncbi:nitroreductase family protein [Phytoactinopolyspora limicola]|uniref:nitroreductase family protein n=1 Tax=Phytoactinopolyspora limicola TaxID=2715536 RepID=UPI001408A093|nr:nitroreductase family protein [Phytoactinopolyspora limicola]
MPTTPTVDPRDPLDGEYCPVPLEFDRLDPATALQRSREFRDDMARRRTVRAFSTEDVPYELIENAVATAATAPSGAHAQPWTFVVVSDPDVKAEVRAAAEEEERRSYESRMPDEWLRALRRLGTDDVKTHLTDAPYVIVAFAQAHYVGPDGYTRKHYYVQESMGIACGLLLASLHRAGLATLTHTPSPMGFLRTILGRPRNERPYLVVPVGYPAPDATVPDITRKDLRDVLVTVAPQHPPAARGEAVRGRGDTARSSTRG